MASDNNITAGTKKGQGDTGEQEQLIEHQESSIHVLYVDNTPAFAEMTKRSLKQYDERVELKVVQNVAAGLERLADGPVDCIVSDYEMPGTNGLEFLEAVRQEHTNLPFILYTSKPCEAIATEALSAGITDYVQKEGGTAHLEILANRVVNAVESWRHWQRQNRLREAINTLEDEQ